MRDIGTMRAEINAAFAKFDNWDMAASECGIVKADGNPDRGLAYRIARGYEPKTADVRTRLGLPMLTVIIVVSGNLPADCQIVGAYQVCECGQRFVRNYYGRQKCYTCRPPRKRKLYQPGE